MLFQLGNSLHGHCTVTLIINLFDFFADRLFGDRKEFSTTSLIYYPQPVTRGDVCQYNRILTILSNSDLSQSKQRARVNHADRNSTSENRESGKITL